MFCLLFDVSTLRLRLKQRLPRANKSGLVSHVIDEFLSLEGSEIALLEERKLN
jgi:hypothetical protein